MIYSRIAIVAIAFGLGACASTTEYAPADNADGYGHHSSKLAENRHLIVFNGGSSTGPNTTRNYALLHAAELTLREGYEWFEVVDRESSTERSSRPGNSFSYERAYYVERSCGLLSCSQSTRPWSAARVNVDNGRARTKYSHALEIVMGTGEMPEGKDYYEAALLATSLIETL